MSTKTGNRPDTELVNRLADILSDYFLRTGEFVAYVYGMNRPVELENWANVPYKDADLSFLLTTLFTDYETKTGEWPVLVTHERIVSAHAPAFHRFRVVFPHRVFNFTKHYDT